MVYSNNCGARPLQPAALCRAPGGAQLQRFRTALLRRLPQRLGWVTDGASNLEELNGLMKEAMLRRKKDEVLDLPPKIRSWVPVEIDGAAARKAQLSFAEWFAGADVISPNDKAFLSRLTKLAGGAPQGEAGGRDRTGSRRPCRRQQGHRVHQLHRRPQAPRSDVRQVHRIGLSPRYSQ